MTGGRQLLEQKEQASIRLYLDFDGTLTGRSGSECVFTGLYKSLQTNPETSYSDCTFKADIVDRIKAGFAQEENKTMQMERSAFEFLQEMLRQGADINIVSRNRKEYIRAVLLAEGIPLESVNKITIYDVKDLASGKHGAVLRDMMEKTPVKVTVVCDDDPRDCKAMVAALQEGEVQTKLISRSVPPGQFDWQNISSEARLASAGVPKEEKSLGKFFSELSLAPKPTLPASLGLSKKEEHLAGFCSALFSDPEPMLPKPTLMDLLLAGTPYTYPNRPGKQYLVFKDEASLNAAVEKLKAEHYREGQEFDFRIAGQPNTLEIRGQIKVASGKIILAPPLPKVESSTPAAAKVR